MEYNYNQEIDNTVEELVTLYDDNVYTNNNNEVSAVMVNDCFNTTAVAIGDLLKKLVNLDVKITAYYGLNLIPDDNNPNKSYINARPDEGWLVRVDILLFREEYLRERRNGIRLRIQRDCGKQKGGSCR